MQMKQTEQAVAIGHAIQEFILNYQQQLNDAQADCAFTLLLHRQKVVTDGKHTEIEGFSYQGDKPFYPASVIKMFYLTALMHALSQGKVTMHPELERAMHDMIQWSSNNATNYIIDLVTETTGDTFLTGSAWDEWLKKRQQINAYFKSLHWDELADINVCQKLMDDDRYGREKLFATLGGNNHNRLTTNAVARLFSEILQGTIGSVDACLTMRDLLYRPLTTEYINHASSQIKGFIGAGLPEGSKLYSKAGWNGWTGDVLSSYNRHDAAYVELPDSGKSQYKAFTLILFTHGETLYPDIEFIPSVAMKISSLILN